MAKREIERTVLPSVLDRLTDEDPRSSVDARVSYPESLRAFRASVQRDLEWLLNTRRSSDATLFERFTELRHSPYNFGMPDITSMSADSDSVRSQLLHDVGEALEVFEPRLTDIRISFAASSGEQRRRELHFVVEATLRLDPTPEQVLFDTVLHFTSGQIDVSETADA